MKKIIIILSLVFCGLIVNSQKLITSNMDGKISVVTDTNTYDVGSDTLTYYSGFITMFTTYTEGNSVSKFYWQDSTTAGYTCQRLILVTNVKRYFIGIYNQSQDGVLDSTNRIKFINFKNEL